MNKYSEHKSRAVLDYIYKIYQHIIILLGVFVFIDLILQYKLEEKGLITCLIVFFVWFLANTFPVRPKFIKATINFTHCLIFISALFLGKYAAVIVTVSETFFVFYRLKDQSWKNFLYSIAVCGICTWTSISIFEYKYGEIITFFNTISIEEFLTTFVAFSLLYIATNLLFKTPGNLLNASKFKSVPHILLFKVWYSFVILLGAIVAGVFFQLYFLSELIAVGIALGLIYAFSSIFSNSSEFDSFDTYQSRFKVSFENAPIGMAIISSDKKWLQINDEFHSILCIAKGKTPEETYEQLIHKDDLPNLTKQMNELVNDKKESILIELRLINFENELVWGLLAASKIKQGKNYNLIFQFQDITSRKQAEEKLRFDAKHDSLTKLPNRKTFMSALQDSVKEYQNDKTKIFATVFIDLDNFKIINDTLGHDVGDSLLKHTAKRLLECVRGQDVVARLGGDEFTILLKNLSESSQANLIAERILSKFSKPIKIGDSELSVKVSIGIAISEANYKNADEMLKDADTAMYHSKSRGRNCYSVYDIPPPPNTQSNLRLVS